MVKNGVPKVHFKGFMANTSQTNWNDFKKICGDGNPCLTMVGRECLVHWSPSLYRVTQKYIKPSIQFQHKQIGKDYKDAHIMDNVKTRDA